MKHFLYTVIFFLAFANAGYAQNIRGKIVSEEHLAAQNISIKLLSSNTISYTNKEGMFLINSINLVDTLEITGIGFQTILFPVNRSMTNELVITIKASSKELEEVTVSTGYQKINKQRATGSFSTISKEQFNQQSGSTVLDRLEAITNGLYVDRQTNGLPKIVIRGLSTIQGPRAPLIILNDFPYEGDLNNINPNDIENITVLKDASAASIWGTKAGNGVIVITTKSGKYDQPLTVEISSNILTTEKPALNKIRNIAPKDFIEVERMLYSKGYYNSQLNSQPYLAISPVIEFLKQRDLGHITPAQADAAIEKLGQYNFYDQLDKYVYNPGLNLQQAISVSGGSRNMNWNLNAGWDHNQDVLNAKYDRYTLRSSQRFKLSKRLELSAGIDLTESRSVDGKLGFGMKPRVGYYPSYTQLADSAGNALPVFNVYRPSYIDTAGAGKLLDWSWKPLTDYQNIDAKINELAVLANIGLNYQFKNGLGLSVKYQYGKQVQRSTTIYDVESYMARDVVNTFSSINRTTGVVTRKVPSGGIIDNSMDFVQTQNIRGQASYNRLFGPHQLEALIGGEFRETKGDHNSDRSYGYIPSIQASGSVDFTTPYPNFITGGSTYVIENSGYSGTINRYISLFSNAAYTYKAKYTLSGSLRRDASNLFGATSNNRWMPLWSAGAAWNIAKEKFYRIKWLNVLKLRASYGVSGNADPSRSAVTTIQYITPNVYTQLPTATIYQFKNPDLKWEKVAMFNIGIDFSLFKNRIQGSAEYYIKNGSNLFGASPMDYTAIATFSMVRNVASIKGTGWDFNINSRNLTGRLGWSTQLNLNFNRDKVVKYYLTNKQGSNYVTAGTISAIEGNPVFALYTYKWAGLDPLNGDPQGYYKGQVSKDYLNMTGPSTQITDMQYIGPALPTVIASMGNTFSFKNISLTVRLTGKFGNYFMRPSIDYTNLFSNRQGHPDYALRWQKPGDELITNVPSMVYPLNTRRENFYRYTSILASKADLIRLQYITLTYDLPKPSIKFFVNVNNLGLIWKANAYDIDPEYNNKLEPSRNMAVGIRINFK